MNGSLSFLHRRFFILIDRCKSEKSEKKTFAKRPLHSDPDRYRESVVAPLQPFYQRRSSSPTDDSSKSNFVQTLLGDTSPPIARTPSPPPKPDETSKDVRSEHVDSLSRDERSHLLLTEYQRSLSSSSSSAKPREKQQYDSDFDGEDEEPKESTSVNDRSFVHFLIFSLHRF